MLKVGEYLQCTSNCNMHLCRKHCVYFTTCDDVINLKIST